MRAPDSPRAGAQADVDRSVVPVLRVERVSVRFGGLQALDDVSFDVHRGEILALIGPNGAGKSTLLNVVSGALSPTTGEVALRGERITGLSADAINRRGLVRTFQGAEILRGMTVRENVIAAGVARADTGIVQGLLGLGPSRRAAELLRRAADSHLATVGLGALADTPAATLTAGQQRLLAVARALGTDAELIVLDEPGAGLNATEKGFLGDVIVRLRDAGRTLLFVEHDLGLVGRLAERMVVLDHGRVIASGAPDDVRADPAVIEAYLGNADVGLARAPVAAGAPAAPLLRVDDLVVRYGSAVALDGVSVTVAPGEIVAIVGANGAGKSTLLKAIAGTVAADGGSIAMDGRALATVPAADRVALGLSLAPEGRQLFASLTVRDNLAIGRYGRRRSRGLVHLVATGREERAELDDALARVYGFFPKLRERLSQAAGTLSGGEGQMLAIGRALMNRPRLLMLDEPSFGLAPQVAREILEALPRLAAAGVAILLVEQNARAALHVATRGCVLVNGRVAVEGAAQALLDDPDIARTYLGWQGDDAPAAGHEPAPRVAHPALKGAAP